VRGRASTIQSHSSRFNSLGRWAHRKLSSITRAEVVALHTELGKADKKTTANRAVQLLRRIYNFAGCEPNPASEIEMFAEIPRDRFLQPDELPRFYNALEPEDEIFRDYFLLCLFTGARRRNVLAMRWAHISLDAAAWTIPATEFKTGKAMTVVL